MEEEENWGVASIVEDGKTVRRRVPSCGSWRDFYVNVRDALLEKSRITGDAATGAGCDGDAGIGTEKQCRKAGVAVA